MKVLIIILFIHLAFAVTSAILFTRISKKTVIKMKELCPKEICDIFSNISCVNYIVRGFLIGLIPVVNIFFPLCLWIEEDNIVRNCAYKTALVYINREKERVQELKDFIDGLGKEVNERGNKE